MGENFQKTNAKQIFCKTCQCYIPSASLVESHERGRKHQNFLIKSENKRKSFLCGLYVRGFKKQLAIEEDLKAVFCKYGDIKDIYVDKEKGKYAIVEFKTEDAVLGVLNAEEDHALNGQKLIVKPRKPKEDSLQSDNIDKDTAHHGKNDDKHENLLSAFRNLRHTSSQMCKIVETLELDANQLELRFKVCKLLEAVFKEVYPDCSVAAFGSTASHLGRKGCDLDLTLISEEFGEYQHCKQRSDEDFDTIEGSSSTSSGNTSSASLRSDKNISEVCEILRKFAPGCKNVFPLKTAHCPVIKFEHKDSGLSCDLSLNNRLAVCNSELLSSYCKADSRFRPLAYTIRLWARLKGISGKGGSQFTQYAYTMMLIHYLQRCMPPVLPCLQANKGLPHETNIVCGWECYFNKNPEQCHLTENRSSLGDLLVGFFKYFLHYDYKTNIISIDDGQLQTRSQYMKMLEKDDLHTYFKVGAVYMPDPFELTHNVAQNITINGLENFKKELQNALVVMGIKNPESNDKEDFEQHAGGDQDICKHEVVTVYDQIDLCKLLEAKKAVSSKDKKKRAKVKYVFDVYGAEETSAEDHFRHCAIAAVKILRYDLKMQCSINYCLEKESDSGNCTNKSNGGNDVSYSGVVSSVPKSTGIVNETPKKILGKPHLNDKAPEVDQMCNFHENGTSVSREVVTQHFAVNSSDLLNEQKNINPIPNSHLSISDCNESDTSGTHSCFDSQEKSSRKRLLSAISTDDISEPLTKVPRLAIPFESSNEEAKRVMQQCPISNECKPVLNDCESLQISKDFNMVQIQATAWANTWTKRRQQRRMLEALKEKPERSGDATDGAIDATKPSNFIEKEAATSSVCSPSTTMLSKPHTDIEIPTVTSSFDSMSVDDSNSGAQSFSFEADNSNSSKPVVVAAIEITNFGDSGNEPRSRFVVRLKDADKVNTFHTFFAFFKKEIISATKR